ncbi:MAG: protein kinase [Planctomycetes bacterium]|nr:protein kinase [Planctomycetota bacterium]
MESTLRIFLTLVYEKAVSSFGFDFEHLDILLVQRFKRYFLSHRKSERRKLRDSSKTITDVDREIFIATAIKQIKKLISLNPLKEIAIKRYLSDLIFIMAELEDIIDIQHIEDAIKAKFSIQDKIAAFTPTIKDYIIVDIFNRTEKVSVYKALDQNNKAHFITTFKINEIADNEQTDYFEKFKPLEFIFSPYLLKYRDSGIVKSDNQQHFWYACDYEPCCTLRDIIETRIANNKHIDDNRLMNFSQGLLRGLNEIHKNGYCHANLNPDNIYVHYKNYDIKMKDFSLFEVIREFSFSKSVDPNYLAPEQLKNIENTTKCADIYAFSIILFEMFTNEYPFIKGEKSRNNDLYKENIPVELLDFFRVALDNDPKKRFQKASDASKVFKEPANMYLKRIKHDEDMPIILEVFDNQILQKYAIFHRGELSQKRITEFIDYCMQRNISAVSEERLREILPEVFSNSDTLDEVERKLEFELSSYNNKSVEFDEEDLDKMTRRIQKLAPDDERRKKITDRFKQLLEDDIDIFLGSDDDSNDARTNNPES